MERRKIYGTIIGVVSFVLLIIGVTYAYFYWSSGEAKTNVNLTVTKGLEGVVVYKQGVSILGTDNYSLEASDDYTGGINATIEFWKKPSYTGNIYGQISLEILQMLSIFGTTDANIGKTDTIKWAITTYTIENTTEVLLEEGTFRGTSQGDKFPLTENFTLNSIQTFYKVYIWLDSPAIDTDYSVIGELLSTEISASASDVMSHYGTPPSQVLAILGLEDKVKTGTPDFTTISPVITSYGQNISSGQTVNLNSTITGNRTIATAVEFDASTGSYTLSGTVSTYQSYNNNAVGQYTCNSTATTCSTIYKITGVEVSDATTNYSETAWAGYTSSLTSSSNRAVATSYTFDGTYYQLAGTITTGVSYSTEYESNDSVSYYTCNNSTGTNCSALYKIETVSGTSVTASQRKSRTQNYNYVTEADIYTQKAATYNEDDIGIFSTKDDFGTSYFFRGNIDYNYVKFGKNSSGADMYWRIIRINGDGTIRMIYDGTSAHANGESSSDRYLTTLSYREEDYTTGMGGYNSSYIKYFFEGNDDSSVTSWYEENIVNTGYSNYVADAIYCNDTVISSVDESSLYTEYYGSHPRFSGFTTTPNLMCSQTSDMFTTSTNTGNGLLKYPIGLITVDEAWFAGGHTSSNTNYYLYTGYNYWTMTPAQADDEYGTMMYYNGSYSSYSDYVYMTNGIKPVISLRSDALKSGSGTMTDPFTINE